MGSTVPELPVALGSDVLCALTATLAHNYPDYISARSCLSVEYLGSAFPEATAADDRLGDEIFVCSLVTGGTCVACNLENSGPTGVRNVGSVVVCGEPAAPSNNDIVACFGRSEVSAGIPELCFDRGSVGVKSAHLDGCS